MLINENKDGREVLVEEPVYLITFLLILIVLYRLKTHLNYCW